MIGQFVSHYVWPISIIGVLVLFGIIIVIEMHISPLWDEESHRWVKK